MSSGSRIVYTPRLDATTETESAALAAVYRLLLFECYDKKNAAGVSSTNGNEAKGSQHDRPAQRILLQ
jgi:hypothetical protein